MINTIIIEKMKVVSKYVGVAGGCTVEVNVKAKFVKHKYQREKLVESQWVVHLSESLTSVSSSHPKPRWCNRTQHN